MIVYLIRSNDLPMYIGVGKHLSRPHEHLRYADNPDSKRLRRRSSRDESFYEELRQVGTANVSVDILVDTEDEEFCFILEEELHRFVGLRVDGTGPLYGMRYGRRMTEDTLDSYYRGEANHFYGKKHTEESRKKISEATSRRLSGGTLNDSWRASLSRAKSGENHPMYGKSHSEEARKKISEGLRSNPEYVKKLRGLKMNRTSRFINKGLPVPKDLDESIAYWESVKLQSESAK